MSPTLSTASHNWEGTLNFQLLPDEQEVWILYLVPQLLRLPTKGWTPPKANEACICKTTANEGAVVKWHEHTLLRLFPPGIRVESRKNHASPSLALKGFICIL